MEHMLIDSQRASQRNVRSIIADRAVLVGAFAGIQAMLAVPGWL